MVRSTTVLRTDRLPDKLDRHGVRTKAPADVVAGENARKTDPSYCSQQEHHPIRQPTSRKYDSWRSPPPNSSTNAAGEARRPLLLPRPSSVSPLAENAKMKRARSEVAGFPCVLALKMSWGRALSTADNISVITNTSVDHCTTTGNLTAVREGRGGHALAGTARDHRSHKTTAGSIEVGLSNHEGFLSTQEGSCGILAC